MKKIRPLLPLSIVVSLGAAIASCGSFSSPATGSGSLAGSTGVSGGSGDSSSSGGSGNTTSAGGSGNTSSVGGSGDTSSAGSGNASSGGGSSCASGTLCNGTCVTTSSDNANCGACAHACASDQTCQTGTCACASGRALCAGSTACIDTSADPANCGSCGKACASGQVCSAGACTATCATGLSACSGACVDLATNQDNCGTCGTACAAGQACTGSACACASGQTSCSGTCKTLATDVNNCGACGKVCTTGQTCAAGACTGGTVPGVCDLLATAGNPCAAAHSTTRTLYSAYTGPLYQVCKGTSVAGPSSCTSGMTKDIGSVGGYADSATQDTFCSGATCTISVIYDQSANKNDLLPAPAGGAKNTPDNPASATALKTTLNTHPVYGILIKSGIGYRRLTAKGTATGDAAESVYMVSSQQDLVNGCCFDYGNAETDAHDDGNGTMEAVYLGNGVVWGTGVQGGPWVEADLENGLYAGWENNQDRNISTNTPLKYDFVNAVVVGDVRTANAGKGRFALYGGDATTGALKTMYDGIRPAKTGYVPMAKQGSIILGIGGDNSDSAGGRWYEGVMTSGAWSLATVNALQANIVAAKYGK
jgi:Alpha-L-arabinofuranosidase B, catalytic/Stigma-specific protein, Stig1